MYTNLSHYLNIAFEQKSHKLNLNGARSTQTAVYVTRFAIRDLFDRFVVLSKQGLKITLV